MSDDTIPYMSASDIGALMGGALVGAAEQAFKRQRVDIGSTSGGLTVTEAGVIRTRNTEDTIDLRALTYKYRPTGPIGKIGGRGAYDPCFGGFRWQKLFFGQLSRIGSNAGTDYSASNNRAYKLKNTRGVSTYVDPNTQSIVAEYPFHIYDLTQRPPNTEGTVNSVHLGAFLYQPCTNSTSAAESYRFGQLQGIKADGTTQSPYAQNYDTSTAPFQGLTTPSLWRGSKLAYANVHLLLQGVQNHITEFHVEFVQFTEALAVPTLPSVAGSNLRDKVYHPLVHRLVTAQLSGNPTQRAYSNAAMRVLARRKYVIGSGSTTDSSGTALQLQVKLHVKMNHLCPWAIGDAPAEPAMADLPKRDNPNFIEVTMPYSTGSGMHYLRDPEYRVYMIIRATNYNCQAGSPVVPADDQVHIPSYDMRMVLHHDLPQIDSLVTGTL